MLESQPKSEQTHQTHLDIPGFSDDETDLFDDSSQPTTNVPKRKKRSWIIAICIILLIIVLGGVAAFVINRRTSRVAYLFQSVTTGGLSLTVNATGPVQGTVYNAVFLASGSVSEIDVKVGQQVNTGQTLAKLNTTALQDAVNTAQAQLTQQKDYGTQDAINIAQDQLTTAQHNLNNATLTAPHSGIITAINGTVGGLASAGGANGGSTSGFIQIVDTSTLQVQANVNESDIGTVKIGEPVQFSVNAYPNVTFTGTIGAIAPMGQTSANVVTYPVTINITMNNLQNANLLPGMTANVTISSINRSNILLMPIDAVNFAQSQTLIPTSDRNAALAQAQQMLNTLKASNKNILQDNPLAGFVIEQVNGQWIAKPVVLGLSDGTAYEVLSGLSANDSVVVGQQVRSGGFLNRAGG